MSKSMDSTIYAAAAKVSAVDFFYRPSVQLHHIFFLLQKNFQSTAQISSSFHSWMLEKLFIPTPSEVVSSDTDLPPTPEMSSGLGIMREHSHLAEPDIRHILFSTRSLPHFTTCLHSNPRQQDWIQLKAGHGHRSLNILSREVDELQPLSLDKRFHQSTKNKVTNFIIISMLQDTGSPSWGNIPMTLSTNNQRLAGVHLHTTGGLLHTLCIRFWKSNIIK